MRLDAEAIHLWRIPYARALGRGPLRALLGAYSGRPAATLKLVEGAQGKPRLASATTASGGRERLEFNWSHSGQWALIALARGLPLGVDIERLGRRPHALALAQRFFDPAETAALAALDGPARERAFIALWCAKEAVLKATGAGLSFGPARFAFTLQADGDPRLARTDPVMGEPQNWQMAHFAAAGGYRGALAWRGAPRRILALQAADDG
jgi:4'-phosphopantetheinyl transferase